MKSTIILLLIVFCFADIYAQNRRVDFVEEDFLGFEEKMLEEKKVYMVYYHASWCGPCNVFQRETLHHTKVVNFLRVNNYPIYRVDVDRNRDLKKRYEVKSIPTVIVFNSQGEEVYRFTQYVTANRFLRKIKQHQGS